jgi:hypothetical protein
MAGMAEMQEHFLPTPWMAGMPKMQEHFLPTPWMAGMPASLGDPAIAPALLYLRLRAVAMAFEALGLLPVENAGAFLTAMDGGNAENAGCIFRPGPRVHKHSHAAGLEQTVRRAVPVHRP